MIVGVVVRVSVYYENKLKKNLNKIVFNAQECCWLKMTHLSIKPTMKKDKVGNSNLSVINLK